MSAATPASSASAAAAAAASAAAGASGIPAAAASSSAAPATPSARSPSSSGASTTGPKKTILKVILLGQAGSGKTSLLNRFVDDVYHPTYKATLGSDLREMEVRIGDEPVVLQIWDTAGQERFNSLTSSFLKGANCCMLAYDLTRADSFEALSLWRDQFLASTRHTGAAANMFPFAVVANKSDLATQRAVSQRRAHAWCAEHGDAQYTEVSAKEGANVHQAFMDLARKAMKQLQAERASKEPIFTTPPNVVLQPTGGRGGMSKGLQDAPSKRSKLDKCCQ